jgi:starch phosphorylase
MDALAGTGRIAYFSMEIALEPETPTYSGGLGVLAGDTIRSAADLGFPMIAVSLVHRAGYFRQHLDAEGNQREEAEGWNPGGRLGPAGAALSVQIEGREVALRAWRHQVLGAGGHVVPVYLLDSDLEENAEHDRRLTDWLYGGDARYRLAQEALLGLGGAALVHALGEAQIYHLNEGHSALLVLSLLDDRLRAREGTEPTEEDLAAVRRRCVFTTHTPLPAGHDRFPFDMVRAVLGERRAELLARAGLLYDGELNMTRLALRGARYVNGVSIRHAETSRAMFGGDTIHAITNGVHAKTWTSAPFAALFDRHVRGWRSDNVYLRYADVIPLSEIEGAHRSAKAALFEELRARTGESFDPATLTIGFARRAASYKRAELILSDAERLAAIARETGPLLLVYGGKAHPHDNEGKSIVRHVIQSAAALRDGVRAVYLENYEMRLAAKLTAGVDVWLNTPVRPLEASGTSGMKAALNGVPSLSVLDGWWLEGCIEDVTGWGIGGADAGASAETDAALLYEKLAHVAATFYRQPEAFARVRRCAIALNGSFFNTQRMLVQYAMNAYQGVGDSRAAE